MEVLLRERMTILTLDFYPGQAQSTMHDRYTDLALQNDSFVLKCGTLWGGLLFCIWHLLGMLYRILVFIR